MVKTELKQRIADLNPDLPPATCNTIVEALFELLVAHIAEHGRVELRNFASFSTVRPKQGVKFNPRTGQQLSASAVPRVKFRASSALAKAVNSD